MLNRHGVEAKGGTYVEAKGRTGVEGCG